MSIDSPHRATLASRTLVASLVMAFAAAGLLALAVPVPAAAPSAPWFGANIMVNAPPAYSGYQPSLAVDANGVLYLAYGGWGGSTTQPDIAVDSAGLIHVIWTDGRNIPGTGPDIYYANSTDTGLSFNPSLRVNNDAVAAEQGEPAIAVASDRSVYAVWTDPRNGARGSDIYFSKSTDLGATWSPNFFVNDDAGNRAQSAPDIAVDGSGTVYVAWSDSRAMNTGPDIYAARSSNGGASFTANVKVNDDAGATYQGSPSLSVNAGRGHAAWTDERTRGSSWRGDHSGP